MKQTIIMFSETFIILSAIGVGVFGAIYLCGRMSSGVTRETVRTNQHLRINADAWGVAALCGTIASPVVLYYHPMNPIFWGWGLGTIIAIFTWRFWSRKCHNEEIKEPIEKDPDKR